MILSAPLPMGIPKLMINYRATVLENDLKSRRKDFIQLKI